MGTRHIKKCRSVIWSFAVVLDFAKAVLCVCLACCQKSTNIIWFLAAFHPRLPSATGKEAFSNGSGLLFNTVRVTLVLLRVN